jgi:hypothetical protein
MAREIEEKNLKENLVEVELFKDNKDYKDDVFVCVNGKDIVIKRGEKVMVDKKYKEVIDASKAQDQKTAELIETKQNEYREEVLRRNI